MLAIDANVNVAFSSRSEFNQCYNEKTGEASVPRSWGSKVGDEYKAELLDSGYHTAACVEDDEEFIVEDNAADDIPRPRSRPAPVVEPTIAADEDDTSSEPPTPPSDRNPRPKVRGKEKFHSAERESEPCDRGTPPWRLGAAGRLYVSC